MGAFNIHKLSGRCMHQSKQKENKTGRRATSVWCLQKLVYNLLDHPIQLLQNSEAGTQQLQSLQYLHQVCRYVVLCLQRGGVCVLHYHYQGQSCMRSLETYRIERALNIICKDLDLYVPSDWVRSWSTGWHITLLSWFRWHQIISCILVQGACTLNCIFWFHVNRTNGTTWCHVSPCTRSCSKITMIYKHNINIRMDIDLVQLRPGSCSDSSGSALDSATIRQVEGWQGRGRGETPSRPLATLSRGSWEAIQQTFFLKSLKNGPKRFLRRTEQIA